MAYQKKTWLARLGQGLNKFIFNGGSKVTLDSSPDVVTQEGTALSADNMNDLEQRIDDEFTNVNSAITSLSDKKIIRIIDVYIGNISIPSTGYVKISTYRPSCDGYSLLSCAIKNYGSFTSGTPAGFFVDANGTYITGPASSTIANITVQYIFVKTENLYNN